MKNSMNSGISKYLRHIVFERDSYTCILCKNGAMDIHHAIPRSQGGRNYIYNLVSLCRRCHMYYHGGLTSDPSVRDAMQQFIFDYLAAAHPDEYQTMTAEWMNSHEPSCNTIDNVFDPE